VNTLRDVSPEQLFKTMPKDSSRAKPTMPTFIIFVGVAQCPLVSYFGATTTATK
jgi:hypothetical protein